MTVYIDSDYIVHKEINTAMSYKAVEDSFFDGLCDTAVEGMRYIPKGETWTRRDGKVFRGLMIAPANWSDILEAAQKEYEKAESILDILINGGHDE